MSEKRGLLSLVIATIAIVIGVIIVWRAFDVFLLAFAAILLSLLLSFAGKMISKWTKIPYKVALVLFVLVLMLLITLVITITAPLIIEQVSRLIETIPKAFDDLRNALSSFVDVNAITPKQLTSQYLLNHEKIFGQITALFSLTVGTLTSMVVFILVGLYLAFNPTFYVKGVLYLFPEGPKRKRVENFLMNAGNSLRWWMGGKFISMVINGVASGIGLWLLDVPLAFVLAVLAALLTFIPYLGAIVAAIPAILIGLTISPLKALYVIILYVIIHTVDGYMISPFVDQRTVSIPPALTIMVQVLLALLTGFLGLALASPITVVALLFVAQFVKRR